MVDTAHLETARGDFRALVAGATTAPLAVILHGFPDIPTTFIPMIEHIAERGFRVVAPWLRGYAPSPLAGPYHVDALAADVLALADRLRPGQPFHLVGHDWGALIAYVISALAPHRLASTVAMSVPHPRAFARNVLRTRQAVRSWYIGFFHLPGAIAAASAGDFALIDRLWRSWSPSYRLPEPTRDQLHRCLRASWPAPLLYYRAALRPTGGATGLRRLAAGHRLEVPILYLHGADDGCVGPDVERGAERYVAGPYRAEILPGVGHFLAAEAPLAVARLAADWMAEVARAAPRSVPAR